GARLRASWLTPFRSASSHSCRRVHQDLTGPTTECLVGKLDWTNGASLPCACTIATLNNPAQSRLFRSIRARNSSRSACFLLHCLVIELSATDLNRDRHG